jgi:hypothetical protein
VTEKFLTIPPRTSARSAVVNGDVLAHVGVIPATHYVVRHGAHAIAAVTGRDNVGNPRTGSVTVGAHMVHFLRNEQIAEFAILISMSCRSHPQKKDGHGGGDSGKQLDHCSSMAADASGRVANTASEDVPCIRGGASVLAI